MNVQLKSQITALFLCTIIVCCLTHRHARAELANDRHYRCLRPAFWNGIDRQSSVGDERM